MTMGLIMLLLISVLFLAHGNALSEFIDDYENENYVSAKYNIIRNSTCNAMELNYTAIGADWMNASWLYRKNHTINNRTGASTQYVIEIDVFYGVGVDGGNDVYLDSKCQTDFDDIRFTDNDGITELDYWIEGYTDSVWAMFWIKIMDNLNTSNVLIYIYYNCSGVVTTSNGDNTFLYFDDFEDDTVGVIPNNWVESENPAKGSTLTTAGGYRGQGVQITSTAITYKGTRAINLVGQYSVELRWRMASGNGEFVLMGGVAGSYHLAIQRLDTQVPFRYLYAVAVWANTGVNKDYNWHKLKWFVDTASDKFTLMIDGWTSPLRTIYGTHAYTSQWGARYQQTGSMILDDMFARKWVDPEPIHGTWGYEEISGAGYYSFGYFYTTETLTAINGSSVVLLTNSTLNGIITVEFSIDNNTWLDHNDLVGSDNLVAGNESIDIRDLSYDTLYMRYNFSRGGPALTPRLYQIRVIASGECPGNGNGNGEGSGAIGFIVASFILIPIILIFVWRRKRRR